MITPDETVLPQLRHDLVIQADHGTLKREADCVIHDPVQHRYFRVDNDTFRILEHWKPGETLGRFVASVNAHLAVNVSALQIKQLIEFLARSNLVETYGENGWKTLAERQDQSRVPGHLKLLAGHLFFKLPLFRPQAFLNATAPLASPFFSKPVWGFIVAAGLAGLYLASRQWHEVIAGFSNLISLQGTLYFLLALVIVKIVHELGHAFAAQRFGCSVPQMGIAFMLMMPMLYTDVSDAWRLPSKRQKMLISGAGVLAELGLAMVATLLWVFLDDGFFRQSVFVIATTSWVLSMFFNLNPCMKFDGYYLLSDYLGIDNMQSRAFELFKWRLRRSVFAPDLPPPEILPDGTRNFLIAYSVMTFIYRITLALAIIVMVYHHTFKLLAIVLLAIETWLLLLRPLVNEISAWRKLDTDKVSLHRASISAGLVLVLVLLLFAPLPSRVDLPAVLQSGAMAQVFPVQPARIIEIEVQENDHVQEGDPILVLEDDHLKTQIRSAQLKLDATKTQLARAIANARDKSDWLVLNQEMQSQQVWLQGLKQQQSELILRAPVSGKIVQLDQTLHVGRWIGSDTLVALIEAGSDAVIRGYAEELSLDRFTTASVGKFVPNDVTRASIPVSVKSISEAALHNIERPELLETHGGPIKVDQIPDGEPSLTRPLYLVELTATQQTGTPNQIVPGIVAVEGGTQSIAHKAWLNIGKVLIREVGF